MSEEKKYNVVVGKDKHGEIIVLDYIFKHDDGFKGAVGSIFRPIDKAEYRERRSRKAVVESLLTCGDEDFCKSERQAIKMYQDMKNMGELDDFCFDGSYWNMHEPIREAFKLTEKKYPILDCTGGGRIFSRETLQDMEQVVCPPEIITAIMEAEDIPNEEIKARLEYLRGELKAERISYGEIAELQSLVRYIEKDDVELLEAAGVPEHKEE